MLTFFSSCACSRRASNTRMMLAVYTVVCDAVNVLLKGYVMCVRCGKWWMYDEGIVVVVGTERYGMGDVLE